MGRAEVLVVEDSARCSACQREVMAPSSKYPVVLGFECCNKYMTALFGSHPETPRISLCRPRGDFLTAFSS